MINIQKTIELFKCHEWVKFIIPNCGEREYETVEFSSVIEVLEKQLNNGWIPTSERLPQLPDGKSFMPLNTTMLAPSGLRNTVQMTWELKRGKPTWCYLGEKSDWNVIAWQPLPEPWEESVKE